MYIPEKNECGIMIAAHSDSGFEENCLNQVMDTLAKQGYPVATIAFPGADEELIEALTAWCESELKVDCLLQFHFCVASYIVDYYEIARELDSLLEQGQIVFVTGDMKSDSIISIFENADLGKTSKSAHEIVNKLKQEFLSGLNPDVVVTVAADTMSVTTKKRQNTNSISISIKETIEQWSQKCLDLLLPSLTPFKPAI